MKYLSSEGEIIEVQSHFLMTAYNYDRSAVSEAFGLECGEPTLTGPRLA